METTRDKIERMYELYEQPMYKIAYRVLGDEYAAEDAVHDAFVKLIANRGKIADPCSEKARAYAKSAVKSAAIDVYRRRQREADIYAGVEAPDAEEAEAFDCTVDLINDLPAKYEKVVRLRFIDGLTTAETAAVMRVTESCVKKRVERAKKLLAELINERRYENG